MLEGERGEGPDVVRRLSEFFGMAVRGTDQERERFDGWIELPLIDFFDKLFGVP